MAHAAWGSSEVQKIKKLSETPGTVPIVAKLCMIDCKNRKIADFPDPFPFLDLGDFYFERSVFWVPCF